MQYSPKGMDSAYLAAVERGDTETAQKMVDDAAGKAAQNAKTAAGEGSGKTRYEISSTIVKKR